MLSIPLSEIKPWENNKLLRGIRHEGFDRIKKNLQLGQHTPLLVYKNENNEYICIGGNHRLLAMKELNYAEVDASLLEFGKDEEGYFAIINGKTYKDSQGKITKHFTSIDQGLIEFSFSHNMRGAFYLEDEVANMVGNFPDIEWNMYDADFVEPVDLEKFGDRFDETVEDEAPEVSQEPAKSELGKVYQLGRHRLMCGDATKIEDVEKLMDGQKADMVFTDPPYGVNYQEKAIRNGHTGSDATISGDDNVEEAAKVYGEAFKRISENIKDGTVYYICAPQGGDQEMMIMMMMMMLATIPCRHQLIWKKDSPVFSMGRLDYDYQHEPILYGWKGSHTHIGGGKFKTSIWEIPRPKASKLHPTMKPVELVAEAIKNSTKEGDAILDVFGGSGSTLMAAEQTNRVCYMMELDPRYVDVIRKRYAKFIGKEAEWEMITTVT